MRGRTKKHSLQPRSSPSVAPKPHQALRPFHLQPLYNLRDIASRITHTGLKTLAQICRRDEDGDGDEDVREGGVQDTGLISKGWVVHHQQHLGSIRLHVSPRPAARQQQEHRLAPRLVAIAVVAAYKKRDERERNGGAERPRSASIGRSRLPARAGPSGPSSREPRRTTAASPAIQPRQAPPPPPLRSCRRATDVVLRRQLPRAPPYLRTHPCARVPSRRHAQRLPSWSTGRS